MWIQKKISPRREYVVLGDIRIQQKRQNDPATLNQRTTNVSPAHGWYTHDFKVKHTSQSRQEISPVTVKNRH